MQKVDQIIAEYAALCQPAKVTIITDSVADHEYARQQALAQQQEQTLAMTGHTVHFDGSLDQGRDRDKTKVLLEPGQTLSAHINSGERATGLQEMTALLRGSMAGREMFVGFFNLGPLGSEFAIPCLQITDSAYVMHSETLLYRPGYAVFQKLGDSADFFSFVHSSGRTENGVSLDVDKKRIYIDLAGRRVFSVNTQYAGNSVGLKKLAFRLTIQKAHNEGWLSEHMFIMGVHPPGKNRTTYFTGAFPSASGKTSTAMVPGQTIVGDDLAFLKTAADGTVRAVNVEQGIFGILEGVNPVDDPLIYKTLTSPRELIFSNVLINDGRPYWLGMQEQTPTTGVNFSGQWQEGQIDAAGKPIPLAHKNARYTLRLKELENIDPKYDDPTGVPISGIIYGARDPDTFPPVIEALDWQHGVFLGASLESQTTAATIGELGQKKYDPMAIVDFLSIPLSRYLAHHFEFGAKLASQPKIFATNYFLKDGDRWLNHKTDKKVWLIWMEGRVHGEFEAIHTPIGFLPRYEDLANLFQTIFQRQYSRADYDQQFAIRKENLLARLDRTEQYYQAEPELPQELREQISQQRQRLLNFQ